MGFGILTAAGLVGSTVAAVGSVQKFDGDAKGLGPITTATAASAMTRVDNPNFNADTAGFAKNGANAVTLSGTTPVTLSLLDLTSNATTSIGDTVFAHWSKIVFHNTGAADVTIAQAGSNPASLGFAGTTPTLTIPAGSKMGFHTAVPIVVDSTHKGITVTPTAGGSFAMTVMGD